jgi:hypothetical protein
MKINFNKRLKDLDGNDIPDAQGNIVSMNKLLAKELCHGSGNDIKIWDWALRLQHGEELELDVTDQKLLRTEIENNKNFNRLAKAQLLKEFDRQQEEKQRKK